MKQNVGDLEAQGFLPVAATSSSLPSVGTGRTEHTGELRLLLTVLADAMETALQERDLVDPSERRMAETARQESIEWIFSDDRSWPFSFLPTCEMLGIEPLRMRALIEQGLRRKRSKVTNLRRLTRTVSRGARRRRRCSPHP